MSEQMNRSIVITRGHIGQVASIIAGAALLLGVLTLVWQGGITSYVLALLGVALVGIVVWAAVTPREFIDFITGRQARQGTVAVFASLLLIGIVAMLYIVLERGVITMDMTDAQRFSLSPESREIISSINRDVRITGFYSSRMAPSREIDDQIFRQYEVVSEGRITRNYIDPVQQPGVTTAFRANDGDVFVSYLNEDGTVDMSSVNWVPMQRGQEREITEAIARLLVTGNFVVYFDESHGQLQISDDSARGLSNAANLLQSFGYDTRVLDLRGLAETGGSVPDDATAVVLARPQIQFSEEVIAVLDDYLNSGGSLYIMGDVMFTDAPFMAEGSAFSTYLWESWGLRLLDAVVVDEGSSGSTPLDIISAAIFDSAITASIDPELDIESRVQFRMTRPIEVDENPPVSNGRVIMSSPISYAETNLTALAQSSDYSFDADEDIPGPLTTVAFAHDAEGGNGRILLVGDSDFVTNGQIIAPYGNALLFADGIGWMTGFTEEVGFAPRAIAGEAPLIFVSTQELDQIALFTLAFMPGLTLVIGAVVWFVRRRR